jgi:hypothetical protein
MKIKILGPECKNCINFKAYTKEAMTQLGMEAEIKRLLI